MLLIVTSISDERLNGVNNNDLKPPKSVSVFLQFSAVAHTSRVNFAVILGDRPGQAAYEVFSIKRTSLTIDLLNSKSLPQRGFGFGYFFKTHCYFIARCKLVAQVIRPLLSRVT